MLSGKPPGCGRRLVDIVEVDAETLASYPYTVDSPDVRRAIVEHLLNLAATDA